jgi:hypothetical protein
VLLAAAVVLVASMLLASRGVLSGWWLLVNAAIVAAALLFERSAYRPKAAEPGALQPTGERFQDPTTGQLIEVWEDPATGAREYRPGPT